MSILNDMLNDLAKRGEADPALLASLGGQQRPKRRWPWKLMLLLLMAGISISGVLLLQQRLQPLLEGLSQMQNLTSVTPGVDLNAGLDDAMLASLTEAISSRLSEQMNSAALPTLDNLPSLPTANLPQLDLTALSTAQPAAPRRVSQLESLQLRQQGPWQRVTLDFSSDVRHTLERRTDQQWQLTVHQAQVSARLSLPDIASSAFSFFDLAQRDQDLVLSFGFAQPTRLLAFVQHQAGQQQLVIRSRGQEAVQSETTLAAGAETAAAPDSAAIPPSLPVPSPPVTRTPEPVGEFAKTERPLTEAEQAANQLREALTLLQQAQYTAADERLSAALALQPDLHEAREAQVLSQVQQREMAAAFELLQQAVQTYPQYWRYAYIGAQIHYAQKRYSDAQRWLQQSQPEVAGAVDYYALLAVLQRQQGQHAFAAGTYERLLQVEPGRQNWLLGYALSLDDSGQLAQAQAMYQQILNVSALSPSNREYLQQRLRSLQARQRQEAGDA